MRAPASRPLGQEFVAARPLGRATQRNSALLKLLGGVHGLGRAVVGGVGVLTPKQAEGLEGGDQAVGELFHGAGRAGVLVLAGLPPTETKTTCPPETRR